MPKKKINIDELVEEELNNSQEKNIQTVELNPIKPESDLKNQKFNRNINQKSKLEKKQNNTKNIKSIKSVKNTKTKRKIKETKDLFTLEFVDQEAELEKEKQQEEKEFEVAKKEYSKRFKLDKNIKEKLIKKVLFELKIPMILILIFITTFILKNVVNVIFMQLIIIILGVLSIYLYEKSFKKSSIIHFVRGAELNALTYIYILYVNQINIIYNKNISNNIMIKKVYLNKNIVLTYAIIIVMYYVAKCIFMYYYTKKQYIESFNDIKEITNKKKNKNNNKKEYNKNEEENIWD